MQYLVRITIHNGSYDEYQDLHKRMQAAGFARSIESSSSGGYCQLPDATYVGSSSENGEAVRDRIARIAAATAPSKEQPEVFVCIRGDAWWSGLRRVS